jgi:hypothetical protein
VRRSQDLAAEADAPEKSIIAAVSNRRARDLAENLRRRIP